MIATMKYQHGEATITVTPGKNVHNIEIAIRRPGKPTVSTLIAFGQLSDDLAAQDMANLAKAGLTSDGRRVYVGGQGRMLLPTTICTQIDELSLAAQAEAESSTTLYKSQLASIDGLAELRAALNDHYRYAAQFEQMMEDEYNDGIRPPRPAAGNLDELRLRYPRAAAYIVAEMWAAASHDVKASAGTKALQQILAGINHEQAIAEMRQSWSGHCDQHVWD